MAYERIEPFGMKFKELLHAKATADIVNSNGAKPPVRVADYILTKPKEQSAEAMFAELRMWKKN